MRKRLLSMALVCSLVFSANAMSVFAQTEDDTDKVLAHAEAITEEYEKAAAITNYSDEELDEFAPMLQNMKVSTLDVMDTMISEVEPNDWPELADPIFNDYTVLGEAGNSVYNDDIDFDYYKFTLGQSSTIALAALTPNRTGLTILLLDDNEEGLAVAEYLGVEEGFYTYGLGGILEPGTYYIAVWDENDASYSSTIEYLLYFMVETHKHNYQATVTKPTCTTGGYTTYTCSCGHSYTGNAVAATGHKYGNWVIVRPVTETTPGFYKRTCTACPAEETLELPANSCPFVDVKENDYYYDPVSWALEEEITDGWTDTTFAPEMGCTRGQVVTFLWRAAGEPKTENVENPFTDVAENTYYYDAILWAVEEGITDGWTEDTFAPDMTCTRGQIVTFIWRAAGELTTENSENPFTDVAENAYYYDAVLWAVQEGITDGWLPTQFAPEMDCTRGQIVTFLYRYYN